MTYLAKAAQLSLAIHALLVLCGLLFLRYAVHETVPLVIDFSLASADTALADTGPPPGDEIPKPPSRTVAESMEQPCIVKKEQKKKPRQQADKVHKKMQPAKRQQQPTPQETTPQSPQHQELTPQEEGGTEAAVGEADASTGAVEAVSTAESGANSSQAAGRLQGGGGGNGVGGVPASYEYVRRLIMNNLNFPAEARKMGVSGTMVVTFFLKGDGQPDEITITTRSGHEILDTAVVTTIRKIAPFPRPPAPARLIIPIVFNLK